MQMPFEWLVQLVPPLKTRAFSISSSHSVHPNQVHLTINVVSWTTPFKRKRTGLCSAWLAGLDPENSSGMLTKSDLCYIDRIWMTNFVITQECSDDHIVV